MKTITIGDYAVVLGATMPALMAVDAYDRVTVVERDILPHDCPTAEGDKFATRERAQLTMSASQLGDFLFVDTTFRPRGTVLKGEQS